ncbi:MFS transporter [Bacillus sp. EB106-08-02-XG196]|uniref:MFS transporter n=1 Tax=Bacillus sp. EB106-08-02-XG196 TaxID=2737049 RepID=UPI0015C44C07|nr:MFS transporter [Bacillus sp. EB106-08-02-XG196]NWQ42509.1 MFS transporter [Bacillus sp. EB106-08-02-XG196]
MEQTRPVLWTKNFIILSSINFFLTLMFFLLNATIVLYAIDEFDATASMGGLVAGIFIIGTLLGRLITGLIMQSTGPKRILTIGLIFFTLTTLLYFIDYGITFLILTRFIHGFTLGIASTVIGTVVVFSLPASRKGEGIGYFSMAATLATGIGPFIGLYMTQHTGFDMIFSFCLLLGIVSLATAFFYNAPILKKIETKRVKFEFKLSSFIEPRALPISVIILLLAFCFSSILTYISIYAIEIDLGETASFFFVAYGAAVFISRLFTGRLMDKKGANVIMYPAFIIFGVGMFLLSSANNSGTFLLAAALIGLGFGNIQSASQVIAVNSVASNRVGIATATFLIFFEAGAGFGPYLLGLVIPATGYSALYSILGIIGVATSVLYYYLHGKKEHTYRMRAAESS